MCILYNIAQFYAKEKQFGKEIFGKSIGNLEGESLYMKTQILIDRTSHSQLRYRKDSY